MMRNSCRWNFRGLVCLGSKSCRDNAPSTSGSIHACALPNPAGFCQKAAEVGVEFWLTWKRFPEAMSRALHQDGGIATTLVGIRIPNPSLPSGGPYDRLIFDPADLKG